MFSAAVSRTLLVILCVVFALVVGDCVSTYLCLTAPVLEEIEVWEANPLSEWLFQTIGLVPGLLAFVAVKAAGLVIIYHWGKRSPGECLLWSVMMVGAALITAYVNYNNFYIYYLLENHVPS